MSLLVLIGPSGSGKTSVMRALEQRGLVRIVPSWTTRAPRDAQETAEGFHVFVPDDVFDDALSSGVLVGAVTLFGHRYGLPAVDPHPLVPIPAIAVRAHHVDLVRQHHHAVVYHLDCDIATAKRRLMERASPQEETEARLASLEEEVHLGRSLATRTFNSKLPFEQLVQMVGGAIVHDYRLQPLPPPLPAPTKSHPILVALGVMAGIAGLVALGFYIFLVFAVMSWGNHK